MQADIRRPLENEALALAEMFARMVKSSFPALPAEAITYYLEPWSEEKLRMRIRSGGDLLLAAWQGKTVTGLVSGTAPEGGVATIIWLLVDAPARGKGVGKELFAAACDHCRAQGAHKLKLTAPTQEARQFYERCGMKQEGFHPAHWWQADFWSMGLAL